MASMTLACSDGEHKLPILGNPIIVNGKEIFPVIKPFSFVNQDSITVTDKNFQDKVYIADFMFLSCPTICPKMTAEMKKVYDRFEQDPQVMFMSHTIDPKNDSIPLLREYAENLGIKNHKWFFVTGKKEEIYRIAKDSYFATAYADQGAPGGYVHSGGLLLIDKDKHIRGVYDGTNPKETNRLIDDLAKLLKEK